VQSLDSAVAGGPRATHASPGAGVAPLADEDFADALERELRAALDPRDEARIDPAWSVLRELVAEFALRPAKRVRPWLVTMGYALGGGSQPPPRGLLRFAAAVELLHTFMLVHDDVADRSDLRRGGPTLHRALAPFGPGGDLAVVAGDHLFARALELMLESELPGAVRAARYYLGVCRHTAAGQFLDLALPHRPLPDVTAFDALKVAHLKTARYSFAAPLGCGALLAGARPPVVESVERAGRLAGLAFQLRDDLIGLFGDERDSGKTADADLASGKRTFPLLVAWRRADVAERRDLEALGPGAPPQLVSRAREIVRRRGGEAATERAIRRATRGAHRALASLPAPRPAVESFSAALARLARRTA
jgi:geranylgeranyl diphosphate synthase type I